MTRAHREVELSSTGSDTNSTASEDDESKKTPMIRQFMNLIIFMAFIGSMYLSALYIKERRKGIIQSTTAPGGSIPQTAKLPI